MTIDTKKLRELAEAATQGEWTTDVWIDSNSYGWRATGPHHENDDSDDAAEPGCPDEQAAQRDAAFIAAANPQTVLALLDEIERLQAQEKSDNQELLMAAFEIEDLRDRLTTMTEARNEIYTVAKRTFDLKRMTLEEATRLDKLRSVGTDEVGK